MLLILPGTVDGTWRYIDPFASEPGQLLRWRADDDGSSAQEIIPVTIYDVVETEYLPTLLNLNLRSVVRAYTDLPDLSQALNLASQQVLRFIHAADACDVRPSEFLEAALNLLEWLVHHQGAQPHHLINRWQIEWRNGALGDETRAEIRLLRRRARELEANDPAKIETACAFLLGEPEEIEFELSQLSEETLHEMQVWPIWRLRHGRLLSEQVGAPEMLVRPDGSKVQEAIGTNGGA